MCIKTENKLNTFKVTTFYRFILGLFTFILLRTQTSVGLSKLVSVNKTTNKFGII